MYGVSPYIERCVQSVLHQSYSNIECIIVNDDTPDDSIKKCKKTDLGGTGLFTMIVIGDYQQQEIRG